MACTGGSERTGSERTGCAWRLAVGRTEGVIDWLSMGGVLSEFDGVSDSHGAARPKFR